MNRELTLQRCQKVTVGTVLLASLLFKPQSVFAQDAWRQSISAETTETQFIRDFGIPSHVETTLADFVAIREGKTSVEYRFSYNIATPSNLVTSGPLGESEAAMVYFGSDRRVQRVEWKYPEGYRFHTRTHESRTEITREQIEALAGGGPITTRKMDGIADAKFYDFDLKTCHVQVWYLGAGSEVSVIVTYR